MKKNNPWRYLRNIWEGKDHKPSGKRILGIILILFSCFLSLHGMNRAPNDLAGVAIIVTPFLASGLAFWGITEWSNVIQNKHKREKDDDALISPDYD